MSTYNLTDLFDAMWNDFGRFHRMFEGNSGIYQVNFPPLNVWLDENQKDLYLEFAVAGYGQDDIELDAEGDYLYLKINPSKREREGLALLQKGISEAKVQKKFYVPSSRYNLNEVKAHIENGLLVVHIPARESAKPQRIMIEQK